MYTTYDGTYIDADDPEPEQIAFARRVRLACYIREWDQAAKRQRREAILAYADRWDLTADEARAEWDRQEDRAERQQP